MKCLIRHASIWYTVLKMAGHGFTGLNPTGKNQYLPSLIRLLLFVGARFLWYTVSIVFVYI